MSLRKTLGLSLALLVMSTAAFAKTVQVAHPAKPHSVKAPGSKTRSSKARSSKLRRATEAPAKLFSPKVFGAKSFTLATVRVSAGVVPILARHAGNGPRLAASRRTPPERARAPARKSAAVEHRGQIEHRGHRVARAERASPRTARREHRLALRRPLARDALFTDRDAERSVVQDASYSPVQSVDRLLGDGPRQVGNAAWYGGERIGRRTASGTPLDTIHPTAAHRSLPLNSLARVTNLRNGRSVVVTVNDRGPVSHGFIIDLSPKAAEDLDMMHAGVAPVSVEPVIEQSASLR
jgi:rare lipoprotein A